MPKYCGGAPVPPAPPSLLSSILTKPNTAIRTVGWNWLRYPTYSILFVTSISAFGIYFEMKIVHRWTTGEITPGLWPVFWAKMRPVHWNFSWFSPSSKFQTTTTHMLHDHSSYSCLFSKKRRNILNIIKTISYRCSDCSIWMEKKLEKNIGVVHCRK